MADPDSNFEILDLTALPRRDENWLRQMFGDISRQSAAKQVAVGGATGWVSGYLFVKVGKLAAFGIGTTVLLLQIAQHQGFIQINWNKINIDMNRVTRKLEREANRNLPYLERNMKRFFKDNMFLTASFAGGFLIGMAF